MTFQLYYSPASPFARTIILAIHWLELVPEMTLIHVNPIDNPAELIAHNPLGKIPTLILEDGTAIYDSRVILEYLNERSGGRLLPRHGRERTQVLVRQSLAQGVMEASVLLLYEYRFHPEGTHSRNWLLHQQTRIERVLGHIGRDIDVVDDPPRDIGDITLACALGYLDLRYELDWRSHWPALHRWLDRFARHVPAFAATQSTVPDRRLLWIA